MENVKLPTKAQVETKHAQFAKLTMQPMTEVRFFLPLTGNSILLTEPSRVTSQLYSRVRTHFKLANRRLNLPRWKDLG